MTTETFHLPDLGEGLTEADILAWHVAVGDDVTVNQTIVEVETAKAAVELPCPFDGTVSALLVAVGDTVSVGSPIISIATSAAHDPDGAVDDQLDHDTAPVTDGADTPPAKAADDDGSGSVLVGYGTSTARTQRRRRRQVIAEPDPDCGKGEADTARPAPTKEARRPRATPPVRKMAKELGVDLANVAPERDRVRREDLRRHLEVESASSAPAAPAERAAEALPLDPGERRVPITGVRKATATAMVASAFTAPHVTEFITVDVTAMMETVESLKAHRAFAGVRVTPLLLVARALLSAIRHHPDVNARWDEANQEIVHQRSVNLGIAVASPRGLVVPNIKDAAGLPLGELARSLSELTTTARDGRTSREQMAGGTITITNVGAFGVDAATPILNPGEAAILCFGAVRRRPWEYRDEVALRQVTELSLSFDHRLVDGELGSKVLARVAEVLGDPAGELLLD